MGDVDSIPESGRLPESVDLTLAKRRQMPAIDPAKLDRLPPQSIESEQGVLGCILWAPNDCMPEVESRFGGLKEEWCYDLRHQTIYDTIKTMRDEREAVDLITLQQRLKDNQVLDQVGGIAYLSSLQDAVPSAANLSHYLDIVEEKFVLRKSIRLFSDFVARAYLNEGEVDTLLDEMERDVLRIRIDKARKNDIRSIQKSLLAKYQVALERQAPTGLMTGFYDLDRKVGGMMGQEMIVIGATPSGGKTTLAQNIAFNIAEAGTVVSISSLETSAEKLVHRWNCMAGKVDGSPFLNGNPTEEDIAKMSMGQTRIMALKDRLLINDHGMTEGQWAAQCRKDHQAGARLFVLDMIQLLDAKGKDEFERVTNASKCIKRVAKELDCPVIAISSITRISKPQGKKSSEPTMHDLKQSGQIESDADKIYLLSSEDGLSAVRTVKLNVAKNKDGATGPIYLTLLASQFRFESQSQVDDADVPETRNPHNS